MPKNSSMKIRTSASLIPTSSFQIARTNFIAMASNRLRSLLASGRQRAREPNLFDRARLTARRARRNGRRRRTSPAVDAAAAWRDELRATLALAWPLILANLTQQAIQATDVLLMGRLGATQLAAATLALNLTFTFNLLLLGLRHRLLADDGDRARPAVQRGARRPPDVPRRPVAARARSLPPYWLLLWHVGRSDARLRPVRRAGQPGPDVPARLHVVHRAVAAVPAAAPFRRRARAAARSCCG